MEKSGGNTLKPQRVPLTNALLVTNGVAWRCKIKLLDSLRWAECKGMSKINAHFASFHQYSDLSSIQICFILSAEAS